MHLHDEDNIPRCAVVFVEDDGPETVLVYLTRKKFTFPSKKQFKDLLLRSVDRHWHFFFQMFGEGPLGGQQSTSPPAGFENLLKMTVF
eukprot:9477794-Pyramimonas_sp.AAC.1